MTSIQIIQSVGEMMVETLSVGSGVKVISSVNYKNLHEVYLKLVVSGAEVVNGLSINDFDDVSSGDVNLLDGSLTNLVYNNLSAGTVNLNMPALDLGAITPVSFFHMYGWTNATYIAVDYRVEVSDDGVNWVTVFTGSNSVTGLNVIPINTSCRFIRPVIILGANVSWFTLSEYKVFSSGFTQEQQSNGELTIIKEPSELVAIRNNTGGTLEVNVYYRE